MATIQSRSQRISTAEPSNSKHPFFWIALLLGAVVFLLYIYGGAVIVQYGALGRGFGWSYVTRADGCIVNYVAVGAGPAGEDGGLQVGDKVLAINNDSIIGSVYPL